MQRWCECADAQTGPKENVGQYWKSKRLQLTQWKRPTGRAGRGGRDGRDGSQAPEFEIEEAFLVTGEDGEAGEVVIDIKLTDWDDAENVLAHIDALLKKAEQKLQVLVDSEVKTAKRKVEEVEDASEDGVNDEAIHETSDSGTSLPSKEKAAAGKRRENPRKHVEL